MPRVLTARQAVNETERRLCGSAAVARPAVAEGLALQGRRAATLLASRGAGPLGTDSASAGVPWVHHRSSTGTASGFAFELAASDVQDAVDHCLVAHELARRVSAPGLCTLAAPRLEPLSPVALPDAALINALDARGAAPGSPVGSVQAHAPRAFRRISELTGRRISAISVEGPEDVTDAIVACGTSRGAARRLRQRLEHTGIRCKLICVHLVRPFPVDAVREALTGIARTLLIPAGEGFTDAAGHAASGDETVATVLRDPLDSDAAFAAACEAFGDTQREASDDDLRAQVGLTALPAGRWAERVLLDAAARLSELNGTALALVHGSLVVGREPLTAPVDAPAVLALCGHPAYLETPGFLQRMGRGGTVVVAAAGPAPARWWASLNGESHAAVLENELSVQWIDLTAGPNLDLSDPGAVRSALVEGFLAAGDSYLAPLSGTTSRTPVDLALLVPPLDGEAESAAEPRPLPQMAEEPEQADGRWRDALRGFHLTGEGAHSELEPTLGEPVRPLVLDAIDTTACREAVRSGLEELNARLGEEEPGMTLASLDEDALPRLYGAAVKRARDKRWQALREEIGALAHRLEELLALDDERAPGALSPEAVESTLGGGAGEFFDPAALAANLEQRASLRRLDESRRQRIETALAALRRGLANDSETELILVRPDARSTAADWPGVREIVHPRGLGAAIGLFDGLAARYADLFRAVRVARLEVDEAYDPKLHDEPLARFDWQSLGEDELLALPRLAVLETDTRLRGAGLGQMAELLRSGRPVHVLVAESTSDFRAAQNWQGLAGFHPGLGYQAVAHREAFVVEASLAAPERLMESLERLASSLRPGAALVAVPARDAAVGPWLQLLAADQARSIPCFVYDPEGGTNWAERFDLDGNPQPERPWPVHAMRYLDEQGAEKTLDQAFTFAHAVALDPAYRDHFRLVPPQAWSSEQMELAEYLAAPVATVARKVPFIWAVAAGRMTRAIVTRELAYASRDRARAWHILQELAGTDNEYARRAEESTRTEALSEAEARQKRIEIDHAAEVEEVRQDAVRAAVDRLARRWVGLEEPEAVVGSTNGEPAGVASPEAAEGPAVVGQEPAAPPQAVTEPYIDSVLCTSCADCININPELFKYDANKQAFITDVTRGTYAQMVKAAEKCPARCIHPGLPRPGDKTANDRLVVRAAKFN